MNVRYYSYCRQVVGHMRCVWEQSQVMRELTDHLEDHAQALLEGGMDRDQAEQAAVEAMGDPDELGRALDRLHSPWPWRVLRAALAAAVLLAGAALVLTLAGRSNVAGQGWLDREERLFSPSLSQIWEEDILDLAEGEAILAQGSVSGGGTIGPYRLDAWGGAVVSGASGGYYSFDGLGSYESRLTFLVSCIHVQPWLEPLDVPWYTLSATDDVGNTYGPDQLYMNPRGGRLLGGQQVILSDPDPSATCFTVVVDTDQGRVSFTAELEEGGEGQ